MDLPVGVQSFHIVIPFPALPDDRQSNLQCPYHTV